MTRKKNRGRNTLPAQKRNQGNTNVVVQPHNESGLEGGVKAVENFIIETDDSGAQERTLGSLFKKAKKSFDSADDKARKEAASMLGESLQALVGELKSEISKAREDRQNYQAKTNSLEQKEKQVEVNRNELDGLRKELNKEKQQIADDRKMHSQLQSELTKKERDLEAKLLDAEAGFAEKNAEMLDKYRQDKEHENEYFEKSKEDLIAEIRRLTGERASLKKKIESESQELLDSIKSREEYLEGREVAIENKVSDLDRLKKNLATREKMSNQYRENDREDIRNEFLVDLNRAENIEDELRRQLKAYKEAEQDYLKQLQAFSKLKEKVGGDNPDELFQEIEQIKAEKEELKIKLKSKPSDDIERKNKLLTKENQDLLQAKENQDAELGRMNTQLRQSRLSVIEREGLSKENLILSKQNELLGERITTLRDEVDDLLSKQQSKTAFPALLGMDISEQHNRNATVEDVIDLKRFIKDMQQRIAWDPSEKDKELFFREEDIRLFVAGLSMSRLHVLQGMSGTGKTSLAMAFARAVGGGSTTVSVQAGWRDKDDLIGHYNSFEKKFYERPCLQGLYEAQTPFYEDRPYIILLDEMNLSRPEQYFAEFLSALELDYKEQQLTLMSSSHTGAPKRFKKGRLLQIPKNVWFIGTANHDETTFEFADKTYDRAHVMELPRNEHRFEIDKSLTDISYSYSSLERAFSKAEAQYRVEVSNIFEIMNASDFVTSLANNIGVGWGNRLERQAKRFISTMMMSGGSAETALDHLLATKVLRHGKATGRYDTDHDDIEDLNNALSGLWDDLEFSGQPFASQRLLNEELKRKASH